MGVWYSNEGYGVKSRIGILTITFKSHNFIFSERKSLEIFLESYINIWRHLLMYRDLYEHIMIKISWVLQLLFFSLSSLIYLGHHHKRSLYQHQIGIRATWPIIPWCYPSFLASPTPIMRIGASKWRPCLDPKIFGILLIKAMRNHKKAFLLRHNKERLFETLERRIRKPYISSINQ